MTLFIYLSKLWRQITQPAVPTEIPDYEDMTYDKVTQPRV
ncbi:MAG: hypothetical protein JWM87_61 [Candidatus Eremiobacteraeota bacterium]|nr:hypothetical protein [Candidatus Eremiobacteraeota bacterium]